MDNKIIILIVFLVAVAGIGGYFVGLYQGAGNVSNQRFQQLNWKHI